MIVGGETRQPAQRKLSYLMGGKGSIFESGVDPRIKGFMLHSPMRLPQQSASVARLLGVSDEGEYQGVIGSDPVETTVDS